LRIKRVSTQDEHISSQLSHCLRSTTHFTPWLGRATYMPQGSKFWRRAESRRWIRL